MRGYFGIGIEHGKTAANIGTLWRSAHNMGAAFIFTIGQRYKYQASDNTKAWRSIPLFQYQTFDEFYAHLPHDCLLVGVEYPHPKATPLPSFAHPERAVYLLGAEDHGLSKRAIEKCHRIVYIPGSRLDQSLNVAVAGSIIMFDRQVRAESRRAA
jgi:tRNA (guanosine-2'-O-)-methyltransferase